MKFPPNGVMIFLLLTMVTILQLKLVKRQLFEKGNLEPFLTKGT